MISPALFTDEVTTIESQIAQLQSQITQLESRKVALGEAEVTAAGVLQAVQEGVAKIAGVAPDAIATLRMAVFNLFNDGSQGGGQPVAENPAPEPLLNGQSCDIDPDTYWEVAAPNGSCWELATPIACQLEDCPAESLRGQLYEFCGPLTQNVTAIYEDISFKSVPLTPEEAVSVGKEPTEDNEAEKSLFELIDLNGSVGYMKRVNDGQIVCCYLGFNSKSKAKMWADWLAVTHSIATKAEVRVAKRLSTKYEIKASGISLKSIEKLVGCDFNLDPRKALPDAPARQPERVPSQVELDDFQPNDIVRSITVKTWQYRILEVRTDGILECQRINVDGVIKASLHPASVELVRRAKDVVDVASEELAEHLEQQAQDAVNSIQPPLKYNAVPLGRRGADANWRALQANGGLNLKASGTGLITMAESIEIERQREEEDQRILASKIADEATAYDDF